MAIPAIHDTRPPADPHPIWRATCPGCKQEMRAGRRDPVWIADHARHGYEEDR